MEFQYKLERKDIPSSEYEKLVNWLKSKNIRFIKTEQSLILQHDEYYFIYRFDKVISAIKAGFSFEDALNILEKDWELYEIDVKKASDRNPNTTNRLLSRIIGEKGKSLRNLEKYTKAKIKVNNKKVYIIGDPISSQAALESIRRLLSGSSHNRVYDFASSYRRHLKNKEKEIGQNIYL